MIANSVFITLIVCSTIIVLFTISVIGIIINTYVENKQKTKKFIYLAKEIDEKNKQYEALSNDDPNRYKYYVSTEHYLQLVKAILSQQK